MNGDAETFLQEYFAGFDLRVLWPAINLPRPQQCASYSGTRSPARPVLKQRLRDDIRNLIIAVVAVNHATIGRRKACSGCRGTALNLHLAWNGCEIITRIAKEAAEIDQVPAHALTGGWPRRPTPWCA